MATTTTDHQRTSDGASADLFNAAPPYKVQAALGLIRADNARIRRRAVIAVLVAWLPLAVLTAIQGDFLHEVRGQSFATDFAIHARFLLAVPLLIVAESLCAPRMAAIARYFLDAGLVVDADRTRFDAAVTSTRRWLGSTGAEIVTIALAYAIVAILVYSLRDHGIPGWHRSGPGTGLNLSAAGWWGLVVSLPLLLTLILGWMWRWVLWTRFLWLMARLDLHLVPSHPDRAAGLGFVAYSVRACAPLGFTFGVVVAGVVANAVVHQDAAVADYRYLIGGAAALSVAFFTAPLLVFFRKLLEAWQRGVFEYGGLADGFGRQFERRWLTRNAPADESMLERPDFSAATDLYQVVDRVHDMRLLPLDLRSIVMLAVATLLPFVPVVFMGLPFDQIMTGLAGFLL